MIIKGIAPVTGMYLKDIPVVKVYLSNYLIWSVPINEEEPITPDQPTQILSCYYNGYWIDEYPWTDDTSWTD